jgi:N6-adenosine-specific RNA methylase IME4
MNETNVMTTETSTALSRYDAVCYALAEVKNLAEIKGIADKMTALKEYARCANNRELEIDAAELRIRAEHRLGQMMDALGLKAGKPKRGLKAGKPKRKGFLNNPLPLFGVPKSDEPVRPTLAQMGIDKNLANRARKLASIPDRVMESKIASWRQKAERDAGRVSVNFLRKDRQTSLHVRTSAGGSVDDLQQLTAAGFRATAILVDPPWKLLTRGNHGGGRTDQHTRTDGLDLIKALPVAQLAAPDAILCMWIADWCPEAAFEVLKASGFVHKTTAFIWAKQKESGEGWHIGTGQWTSPSSENCWLATRGKPKRLNGHVRQLIVAPATEQSLKPDEIHDRIERLVEGPYLELFASRQRRGWVTWGQEVKLEMPDAPSIDPESGEVEIISPSVICVPTQPSGNDGLGLPDFLRRGDSCLRDRR